MVSWMPAGLFKAVLNSDAGLSLSWQHLFWDARCRLFYDRWLFFLMPDADRLIKVV